MKKKKNRKNRKSNWILNIILVAAILCFVGSGAYLLKYYWEGWQAENDISRLSSLILPDDVPQAMSEPSSQSGDSETTAVPEVKNRYIKLVEANADFIGWISIEGTEVDYPVMFTPGDPEKYLHLNFDQEYEYSGLPFVDGRCTLEQSPDGTVLMSDNIIIYGHNMKNSTMFSRLLEYKDQDYYEEHPYVTFNTVYGDGTYAIVSVILARALYEGEEGFKYYGLVDAGSEADFNNYMEEIHRLELYDTGIDAQYGDKLLTLSTCEYSQENGRLAVIAKKID